MESKHVAVEQDVYRLLMKTSVLLDDSDRQFFASYGVNTRQYWALQHLDEQQGCSMVELSRVLFTDKSNVTGIVDRLESQQLVERKTDPGDRRVILITLTAQGRQLRDHLHGLHEAHICKQLNIVDLEQLAHVRDCLRAFSENIELYLEQIKASSLP